MLPGGSHASKKDLCYRGPSFNKICASKGHVYRISFCYGACFLKIQWLLVVVAPRHPPSKPEDLLVQQGTIVEVRGEGREPQVGLALERSIFENEWRGSIGGNIERVRLAIRACKGK